MLQYGGKDVTEVMSDEAEHAHSESAFMMLDDYCIGVLNTANDPQLVKKKEVKFIDINQPMFWQVWSSGWSKEFYLEQGFAKFT